MPTTRDDATTTAPDLSISPGSISTGHPDRLAVAHRGALAEVGGVAAGDEVAEVVARKLRLRRTVRERRRGRDEAAVAALDVDLARVLLGCPLLAGARRVACYASRPGEPGTRTTLAHLRRDDVEVLLPVLRPDADLDWELRAPRSAHPAPEPLGPHAIAGVDLVIVPALAVDTAGHRLGQGGGSYDRALARVPSRVPVLAVVHDEELLDAAVSPLPWLPHDRPVQAVATPSRWLRLTA